MSEVEYHAALQRNEELITASGIPRWVFSKYSHFKQFAQSGYVPDMTANRFFSVGELNQQQVTALVKLMVVLGCHELDITSCIAAHPSRDLALIASNIPNPWRPQPDSSRN